MNAPVRSILLSFVATLAIVNPVANARGFENITSAGIEAHDYNDLRTLFQMTEDIMLNPLVIDFLNDIFPKSVKAVAKGSVAGKGLSSTQVLFILDNVREYWHFLKEYKEKVNEKNVDKPEVVAYRKELKKTISDLVVQKNLDEQLSKINSPSQPLALRLKGSEISYSGLKLAIDHPALTNWLDAKSARIPSSDLRQLLVDAIDSATQEIYMNYFEQNIPQIADALIRAQKRGVKILVGVDKNTIANGDSNKAYLESLQKAKVPVVLVDPVGLNHQKMLVVDPQGTNALLIQSSGNGTQSCIGPEGDLVDVPAAQRSKNSIPNANHTLVVKGKLPALVGEFQLRKTLVYQLRGENQYPIDGSYLLPGPMNRKTKAQDFVALGYSPNGGTGDVGKSILVPIIKRVTGPMLTMQFAFSSPEVIAAVVEKILEGEKSGNPIDFRAIGDTPFAMMFWSGFLALSGYSQNKETGVYSVNKESPLVKGLSAGSLKKLQDQIRVNPKMFGTFHVTVNNVDREVTVKLHHKVWVFPFDNLAIVGTSFNESDAAESNQENLALVRNEEVANLIAGGFGYLWSTAPETVSSYAEVRNGRIKSGEEKPDVELKGREFEGLQEAARGARTKDCNVVLDKKPRKRRVSTAP